MAITESNLGYINNLVNKVDLKKNTDNDIKFDIEKLKNTLKDFEKAAKGQEKLLLATVQNLSPFGNDNNANVNQLIHQKFDIDCRVLEAKMGLQIAAQKSECNINNIANLHGKEIQYNNDTQRFNGKAITFDYNIEFDEKYKDGNVFSSIKILDEKNNVIYNCNGMPIKGNHQFTWDGKDNQGNIVDPGNYKIKVSATGKMTDGNIIKEFPVTASTDIKTTIKAVDTKNYKVTGIVTEDGKVIHPKKITRIANVKAEAESAIRVHSDLLHKNVRLNLNKISVNSAGAKIYYNNTVPNASKMKIAVYDKDNNVIKHITRNNNIKMGVNVIDLNPLELDKIKDGNYNIALTVIDEHDNITTLEGGYDTVITGINFANNTIIDKNGVEFDSINIENISTIYKPQILIDAEKKYKDKPVLHNEVKIIYNANNQADHSFNVKKPAEGKLITHATMSIYDENHQLLRTINSVYNLFEPLTQDSKNEIFNIVNQDDAFQWNNVNNFDGLNEDKRVSVNNTILGLYMADKNLDSDPMIKFTNQQIKQALDNDDCHIKFNWDGVINNDNQNPIRAVNDKPYYIKYNYYILNENNGVREEITKYNRAIVKDVRLDPEDENKIQLILENNHIINEDQILHN